MKMGVQKGMVRNIEACLAGLDLMRTTFRNISLYNETGRLVYLFVILLIVIDYFDTVFVISLFLFVALRIKRVWI